MGTQKPEHARSSAKAGVSQELLEVYNVNPEDFHTRLVTGDETWLHHWDPDTKKESMQWKHPPTEEISYPTISQQGNGHGVLGHSLDFSLTFSGTPKGLY